MRAVGAVETVLWFPRSLWARSLRPQLRQLPQPGATRASRDDQRARLSRREFDELGRQVVAAQLEAHGAAVETASSAPQALDVLQRGHFDVLLADIAMPNEDGYSLIRKVRALYPSPLALIPAAALTAFARNEDKLQALHAGFQLHLVKPIDSRSLVTAVARLGGRFPERRQLRNLALNGSATIQ